LVLALAVLQWLASLPGVAGWGALPGQRALAVGLMLIGVAICAAAIVSFRRARTTVNPMTPRSTTALVVSGLYRMTRNPMYLGFLLVLLGWALWLSDGLALLGVPAFVLYMNRFQIEPEERVLAELFGSEYAAYQARVRRWL
jgi:protein-S-isoprenylcysteine O-methyltransferase Ste14